jgi:tetratricopeptide (TPR) repeat protein
MALYDWDWSGAEKEFQRSIALNPNYATAHQWYGAVLWNTGRMEESMAQEKRALELDPLSLMTNRNLGDVFFFMRQYDQAIEQYHKTLELDPSFSSGINVLAAAYTQKSMFQEAFAEHEKIAGIMTGAAPPGRGRGAGGAIPSAGLAYTYAKAGRRAEALQVLNRMQEASKQRYISAMGSARIYAALEEKDKAFEWLEEAYADRSIAAQTFGIKADPAFDSLRSDPRFANLLRRINLQP